MTSLAVSAIPRRARREDRGASAFRVARGGEADPAVRVSTTRRTRPVVFSDAELLGGVRKVSREIGHPPSRSEYDRVGSELGLACAQTVCVRFGGWRKALAAAGLNVTDPVGVYARRWHIAACWRALERVADQLGDPPRYRRYAALAAAREDLPSGATVHMRLGPWEGIAAALEDRPLAARIRRSTPEPRSTPDTRAGNGRLLSVRAARALAYLAAHPGASPIAAGHAAGMGHRAQASTLLARLERRGLVAGRRVGRGRAWSLTDHGAAVLQGLPEGLYAD